MSAHTPGPWEAKKGPLTGGKRHSVYAGKRLIATFDSEANAVLGAAAPALLQALEQIAKSIHHIALDPKQTHRNCPPCIAAAAIAQVKGTA